MSNFLESLSAFSRGAFMSKPVKVGMMILGLGFCALGSVYAEEGAAALAEAPKSPALTPEALLAQAKASMATIDSAASVISRMLRDARTDKDAVKVLCLDDKLNQIDTAKRTVGERVDAMEAAVASGATETLEFDSAVIGALETRANSLSAEAQQCIGEEKGFSGGSQLQYRETDPDLPSGDVSIPPSSPVVSNPPVAASPVN
jgi:hypothetical protein